MAPRQNRFSATFTPIRSPSNSLRRLRTAFSPSRNPTTRSTSPDSTSSTSSSSMSPLTYSSMSPRTLSPADSHRSTASSIRDILRLRRQPSVLEVELEEERHLFGTEVDTCLEPRLSFGERNRGVEVGIFEVLDGRV